MASARDVFFTEIYNQVKKGEDIYIITADLGAPSLDDFRSDFPKRYISTGIAEQNLLSIAAGMAMSGLKVVAYGLNPFPITRAFDQIRCLMAELNIPFTLCVLNAGLCAAECGYTHMPIEDMAMLRTLSNIDIYNPSDETISEILAANTTSIHRPRIIRFDKAVSGSIFEESYIDFNKGFNVLGCKSEARIGLITNGTFTRELNQALGSRLGVVKLIDLYKIPLD